MARRECSTAGVEGEPKSSTWGLLRNMEKLRARPVRTGQTLPQGGSRVAALRWPKKLMLVRNAPDMPTSAWSRLAREQAEPS